MQRVDNKVRINLTNLFYDEHISNDVPLKVYNIIYASLNAFIHNNFISNIYNPIHNEVR